MYEVVSRDQALELLDLPDDRLFCRADYLRKTFFGNRVDLCAIVNAKSGDCPMDCGFCAQSRHASGSRKCSLEKDELAEKILNLAKYPVNRIGIVTSGGLLTDNELDGFIAILSTLPDDVLARVCVSFGRLNPVQLATLRKIGILRYHHNLETSEQYYSRICSTQTWRQRESTVIAAAEAEFCNCTGGLFGMGESWEDRIDLAFSLKKLRVKNIPLNFLDPQKGTRMENNKVMAAKEALRIIAIFRHILPDATLRICGGRPKVFVNNQPDIFKAGANALMTGNYLTTNGICIANDLHMLAKNGFELSMENR